MWVTAHPFDPWGSKRGGIETFIRLMIRHAPPSLPLGVIGVSEEPQTRPLGQWLDLSFDGRAVRFYAVAEDRYPNRRRVIPLTLTYAMALRRLLSERDNLDWITHRMEIAWMLGAQNPSVLFVHSDPRVWSSGASEVRWRWMPWLYRSLEAGAIRNVRNLFCVNRSSLDWFQSYENVLPKPPRWIQTAFDEQLFSLPEPDQRPTARKNLFSPWGWNEECRVVLFAGRLERQKNPRLALEAFHLAAERDANLRMVVVGDGAEREALEAWVARYSERERIRFAGALPPDQVAQWMQCADLFLMTSRFEGMPITLLEALACGCTVVSTAVGEVGAIVQPACGVVVHSEEPLALANAITHAVSKAERFQAEECVAAAMPYRASEVYPRLWHSFLPA